MTLSVSHPFVSAKPDGADASLIQPSNWNAAHSLMGVASIAQGGTNASTEANARIALGLPTASSAEMQAGTEVALRAMSPDLVAAAIAALMPVYANGTWTPVITADVPGTLSLTYTTQLGQYVRIGKLGVISFRIVIATFTIGTATGNLRIAGLPLNTGAIDTAYAGIFFSSGVDFPTTSPLSSILLAGPSVNYLITRQSVDNTTTTACQIGGLAAGDTISGNLIYLTDDA